MTRATRAKVGMCVLLSYISLLPKFSTDLAVLAESSVKTEGSDLVVPEIEFDFQEADVIFKASCWSATASE